jgi:hypothetical protein
LFAGLSTETFLAYESDNWRRFGSIVQRTIRRRLGIKDHSSIVFGVRVQSVSFRARAFVRLQVSSSPSSLAILHSHVVPYELFWQSVLATTLVLFRGHRLRRDGTQMGTVSRVELHWLGRRRPSVGVDCITCLEESAAAAAIATVVAPRRIIVNSE